MNKFLLPFFLLLASEAGAQVPLITRVVTHNRVTVVTNPKTGLKLYTRWGVFPNKDASLRKITMNLTLGAPDSLPTAHWDYLDFISIRRQGGKQSASLDLELGRMLTPYGSIYTKPWQFTWSVDVSDFSAYLRDSTEIEYAHSGYEPETVGWALTIEFEILYGPPVMQPLGMKRIWSGHYRYGDPKENPDEKILPVEFEAPRGTVVSRLRIQHTGHGMDEPRGCSEFCPRWRELYLDGKLLDHRVLWKDCGDNPLYPQGGTWIYDRAYWCPGYLQPPDLIDFSPSAGKHELGLKMEPYTASGNIQAEENISACLFYYSAPLKTDDVAIEDIIVPDDRGIHRRFNPAGFGPRILIRNLGSAVLHSCRVTYGTKGYRPSIYEWKGELGFGQKAEIELPGEIQYGLGPGEFEVQLSKPNGRRDGWEGDNMMVSHFSPPVVLPCEMIVRLKTNSHPGDNNLCLVSSRNDTVYRRLSVSLAPDRIFSDTLRLVPGLYRLALIDTAGDGLQFWAEPEQGDGYLRLLDMDGRMLHCFESDCGNGEALSFAASRDFKADTSLRLYGFSLYPRKIKDEIKLEVAADRASKMTVIVTVNGNVYEKHEYSEVRNGIITYNLGYLPKGRLVLEVLMDRVSRFKGRFMKEP